jgi:hypothetical protein
MSSLRVTIRHPWIETGQRGQLLSQGRLEEVHEPTLYPLEVAMNVDLKQAATFNRDHGRTRGIDGHRAEFIDDRYADTGFGKSDRGLGETYHMRPLRLDALGAQEAVEHLAVYRVRLENDQRRIREIDRAQARGASLWKSVRDEPHQPTGPDRHAADLAMRNWEQRHRALARSGNQIIKNLAHGKDFEVDGKLRTVADEGSNRPRRRTGRRLASSG